MTAGHLEKVLAKNIVSNIRSNTDKMDAMRSKVANLKRLQVWGIDLVSIKVTHNIYFLCRRA